MELVALTGPWLLGAGFLAADGRKRGVSIAAAAALLAVLTFEILLLAQLSTGTRTVFEAVTGGWPQGVGIRLRVDRLALFLGSICTVILAAVLVHEAVAGVRSRLFPALILLLEAGLHGAFFTGDLFNFYVFFELAVVTSFALAAYGHGRAEVRGAFVYTGLNLFGSALFLLGVAAVYHEAGTLDIEQLTQLPPGARGSLILPAVLLLTALLIKLGAFPFHGWVPVLYSHARPAVAAALSGALVNIGAYGLLRFGFSVFESARQAGEPLLLTLGLVAAAYGSLLAIRRNRPAELAAYVAVVHAGYLVFALAVGERAGVTALLLTVLSGSIDKTLMFLSLEIIGPIRASASLIAAGSVAGLPVTLGFLSKVQLFHAAVASSSRVILLSALLLSAFLVIAAVFRFWRMALAGKPVRPAGGPAAAALAAVTVVLGLFAEPVVQLASGIGADLLEGGR